MYNKILDWKSMALAFGLQIRRSGVLKLMYPIFLFYTLYISSASAQQNTDTISFARTRGDVPASFITSKTTIDSIYINQEIPFEIDSFVLIGRHSGICIMHCYSVNSYYKLLLACNTDSNTSSDFIIGQTDCDIDEGAPYNETSYAIKPPFITITTQYYKYVKGRYKLSGRDVNKYTIVKGKFKKL